jgi:small-conductance mechanosensitive channel
MEDNGTETSAADVLENAGEGLEQVEQLVEAAAQDSRLPAFAQKFGIAFAIVAGQAVLIWFVWFLFKKISEKIRSGAGKQIKPLIIKNLKILTANQIVNIILFLLKLAKYLITVFQLFITVHIVFSLFPSTEKLASTIFGYFLTPLRTILNDVIKYIPNIITIFIILMIAKYALRGLRFFANQIARGRLVIPGFYIDWAWPTYNILKVLIYAFTAAVVYPYLPGAESRAFQGVSVFVGMIISLGSSSAIGNLIAGMVITYMRPFKIGDRIKIKNLTGFVVEKSPFVIRVRNIKNEYLTFPNLTVLNSEIINYKNSEEGEGEGIVRNAVITMGYDVPWRDIHGVLLRAAAKTPHVETEPKPFVLQTGLDDFYAKYEINAYTKYVEKFQVIYSELFQNIQDEFRAAGISMYAPHFVSSVPYTPSKDAPLGETNRNAAGEAFAVGSDHPPPDTPNEDGTET